MVHLEVLLVVHLEVHLEVLGLLWVHLEVLGLLGVHPEVHLVALLVSLTLPVLLLQEVTLTVQETFLYRECNVNPTRCQSSPPGEVRGSTTTKSSTLKTIEPPSLVSDQISVKL